MDSFPPYVITVARVITADERVATESAKRVMAAAAGSDASATLVHAASARVRSAINFDEGGKSVQEDANSRGMARVASRGGAGKDAGGAGAAAAARQREVSAMGKTCVVDKNPTIVELPLARAVTIPLGTGPESKSAKRSGTAASDTSAAGDVQSHCVHLSCRSAG